LRGIYAAEAVVVDCGGRAGLPAAGIIDI